MKINLNPDETVTILDSSGSQIIALSSYSALQQEAKRLGINPDGAGSLAGLGQAVLNAGGNPGLIVTWSGRQVSMTYKGPQNFERFDVWLDGASIDSAFLLSHTTTLPLLPAGTYQVKIAASWAGAVAVDPGVRLSFTYTSDGVGYTQTHPSQVPTRSGAALQDLGGYIRSVFAVYSLTVQTDPAIQTAYRTGAFTHIEEGMFDFVNYPDQASAQAQFNARWARVSSVCSTYGLKILALGDDLCRGNGTSNPAIANALSAWRPAVISAACATMQASGFLTGVLMVDEADFFATAASDAQLDQLMATMRANAPNLKLTWPVHSSGSVRFTSRSDWFDLYWTMMDSMPSPPIRTR